MDLRAWFVLSICTRERTLVLTVVDYRQMTSATHPADGAYGVYGVRGVHVYESILTCVGIISRRDGFFIYFSFASYKNTKQNTYKIQKLGHHNSLNANYSGPFVRSEKIIK